MSPLSWGSAQVLQRSMATRRRASKPGMSEREIQIEEVVPKLRTVRGLGGGEGIDCQDLVRARPVEREFLP